MALLMSTNTGDLQNVPISSYVKNNISNNYKNIEEEYDDNFDDGINDDIIIKNETLNKNVTIENKFQNSNFNMTKINHVKRSLDINKNLDKVEKIDQKKNNNIDLQLNGIEHQRLPLNNTNLYKSPDKKKINIGIIFIGIIVSLIICCIIFLIYYLCCRGKKFLKKKEVKKKKKVAKNAREKGAENRRKVKKSEKKQKQRDKEKSLKQKSSLKKKAQNKEIPMYTAIINEDNNEKLCKANDILGNNYYPQKQIVNKENSTNNVSDISLNEFSYSESSDIPNCIISDFEAPLTFHKCNCSEEGKSKKTVYTQRGNVIEWEVIQEENIYDDFSFQISSSDDK